MGRRGKDRGTAGPGDHFIQERWVAGSSGPPRPRNAYEVDKLVSTVHLSVSSLIFVAMFPDPCILVPGHTGPPAP